MPRPAGDLPLLCQPVQLLADDGQTTLAVLRGAVTRDLKGKPGPVAENQQVPGLHEGELENPRLPSLSPREISGVLPRPGCAVRFNGAHFRLR